MLQQSRNLRGRSKCYTDGDISLHIKLHKLLHSQQWQEDRPTFVVVFYDVILFVTKNVLQFSVNYSSLFVYTHANEYVIAVEKRNHAMSKYILENFFNQYFGYYASAVLYVINFETLVCCVVVKFQSFRWSGKCDLKFFFS